MTTELSDRHRHAAAIVALVCGGLVVVIVALIVLDHLGYAVLALAGLGLAGGGGWYAVTSAGPRRILGAVAAVVGLGVMVWAVIDSTQDSFAAARLVALGILGLVGTVAARIAVSSGARTVYVRRQPPQRPVLICNPRSGGGKVGRFDIPEHARALGVEVVMLEPGLDLGTLARDAVSGGADCVGMAGGDGSQALVASVAVQADLPYVCVSAGTRNHFALDLGLDRDDPVATLAGFTSGLERRVDYATVRSGDETRLFVNNVSLGVYATVVQEDSYRDSKASTALDLLPEMLGRSAEPFDLQFDDGGTAVDGAFLIMVSNNPYVLGARGDIGQRRTIDSGRLGVFAVSSSTGAEAAALMALSALGARRSSPHWHEFATPTFEVRSRSSRAFAGVDGEALDLDTPLEFRSHPGGLRVMVPEDNPEIVRRRHARNVGLDDLLDVARGEGPAKVQHEPSDPVGA